MLDLGKVVRGLDAKEGSKEIFARGATHISLLKGGVECCELPFWLGHDTKGDRLCDHDQGHVVEVGEQSNICAEGEEVEQDGTVGRW